MRHTSRGVRISTAATATVMSAALMAGCGSDGGDSGSAGKGGGDFAGKQTDPAQAVRSTNRKTAEAKTAKLTMTTKVSQGSRNETVAGKGTIDLRDGTSALRIGSGGQQLEQRVVDRVLYQKPPGGQGSRLPAGKTWMKIDMKKLGAPGGAAGTQVTDPADSLGYTKAVSRDDVEKLGQENVGGVRTTHYRVRLDVDKLAKGDAREQKALRKQLGDSLPVELWLDKDGRTRRQQIDMTVGPQAGQSSGSGKAAKARTVIELSGFGTDVSVEPPAAKDTADVTDKVTRQSGGKA